MKGKYNMNGLLFQTLSGGKYFYNNSDGFIYPEKYAERFSDEINVTLEYGNIPVKADAEMIRKQLETIGFRELILETSQACNFRCKYCCYGEYYQNTREHGNKIMDFQTAVHAVDFYIEQFKHYGQGNIWRNPIIAFYGGEPLLNFSLIKNITNYVQEKYTEYNTEFTLTTNAKLMTNDIIDFLVENNFSVIISFDGNKENHNRNRIDINGNGTYDIVYKSINEFRKKYPNYPKLGISLCYDYRTDLFELEKFLNEENLFIVSASMISSVDTNYYEQFTQEEKKNFFNQYNALKLKYLNLAKENKISMKYKGILMPLFVMNYLEFTNHSVYNQKRPTGFPYSNSCIPGEKIYVTLDGNIHICEKMNFKFPIGNIYEGLNYDRMAEMENVINNHWQKCSKCNYSRLCNICFAQIVNDDKMKIDESYCIARKNQVLNILKEYTEIMEVSPDNFDRFAAGYFDEMHIITGNIVD